MLIGISGFAKSGKTTVASYLEDRFGYTRKHIATPLRAMLSPLLQAFGVPADEYQGVPNVYDYLEGFKKEDVIPGLGVTGRHLQVTLGTEWGRELVDPDLWAKAWVRGLTAKSKVINDSVRFPNEQAQIDRYHGKVIMIRRPGVGPRVFKWQKLGPYLYDKGIWWGVHDSERLDRIYPDVVIENDGSMINLYDKLDEVMLSFGFS